jgi:glycine betaine/proline transport system substrate-binding protein
LLAGLGAALLAMPASAAEPESCDAPRIADGGWTDNAAQNGFLATVLKGLGYEPKVDLLSVPVILTSLKSKDIDIWLDNWMPSQTAELEPYTKDGSVESIGVNLDGAGYGPVVPTYVVDAGVRDLKDLAANADKFDRKMYGIEPGNDGNRILQQNIDDPANGLDGWKLVESSEQGMLAQAEKLIAKKEWIIFLGWTPHPVMGQMPLAYLGGFEKDGFGPATVHTLVSTGYGETCPNLGALLRQLKFTNDMEGAVMDKILAGADAEAAAKAWLQANPSVLDGWLAGVTTVDGKAGAPAVAAYLAP